MKKAISLILAALMLAMTLTACGGNNYTQPDADASQPSEQEQAITISSNWHGTYHSTDGDKEIVLTVTGTGGVADIDGSPVNLMAKAEHGHEIHLVDSDGSVFHLTFLSGNPVDKRYDFAVTAKDDPSQIIINSTFMQRGDDTVALAASPADNSQKDDGQNSEGQVNDTEVFPFLDITYKAREYNGTLIFQKPNEEGYPTEIVIDGDTYVLDEFAVSYYDPAKDHWNCGGSGSGTKGTIGFSFEGNSTKWLLRVAGAFDMTSAYYGDDAQGGDDAGDSASSYSFIGTVYKNEDLDLTFTLQTPDANGYPTEIVLNGVTYDETVTFDNEIYALEKVEIYEDSGSINVTADWSAKGRGFGLYIQSDGDAWKMVGPGICSGYYHPQ